MAVVQMKKIEICALKKYRKRLLETIQRKGIIEITDFKKCTKILEKTDTSNTRMVFEKNISLLQQSLNILGKYTGITSKPSSIKGKNSVSVSEYYTFISEVDEVIRVAHRINSLQREITEKKSEIVRSETQIEALSPWKKLDVPMVMSGTKTTSIFIGTIPGSGSSAELGKVLSSIKSKASDISDVHVEIISSSEEQICLFLMCKKNDHEKLETALKQMAFSKPMSSSDIVVTDKLKLLKDKLCELNTEINVIEKEIKSYIGIMNATRFMIDYYSIRKDKYEIIDKLGHTKRTFFIYGYVPEKEVNDIVAYIEANYDACVNVYAVKENEDVPVLLNNKDFVSPVESVLESYSLPGKGEIDPASIMAIFYYVLFGLMLSDAAYGIIMTVGCAYAINTYKNMETNIKKTLKLFLFCGISTIFWGFMFGSFFGDAVEVVSKTFFNTQFSFRPIWFAPIDNPMKMLMFSFGLGVFHIFTGLSINLYQLCKAKRYKDAVYDVVFWMLLVGGAIVYLMSIESFVKMMSLDLVLPSLVTNLSLVAVAFGAVGILLTAGRESRSLIKRFLKGLYGLYNVTGYLSDILSYARLLALGLATGVIANVFNKMASMAGGGFIGLIVFTVVFLLGHSLNIGINLLGAYVHTNRLQFVEFFGKFYKGGGRKFSPFQIKTKYYKIREEINNG